MKHKARACVICGKAIPAAEGLGFSAEPLSNGTCCSTCYRKQVIPAKDEVRKAAAAEAAKEQELMATGHC